MTVPTPRVPGGAPGPGAPPAGRRPGTPPRATSRPSLHLAARLEDAFDRRIASMLRAKGWTLRIEPYAGYGGAGWVRVLARALLAGPGVRDADLPGAGGSAQAGAPTGRTVRGWRSFATAQVGGARLTVQVGDRRHEVVTDRGGLVDTVLESDLAPGWHDVVISEAGGARALAPVHVIGPEARWGIVSDIDDTVMVTRLPRPFVAAWNVFVRDEHAREAVPGMSALYATLTGGRPDVPVVYLSTGAWNAAPAIGRFLRRNGFPAGPLLLTDWGPTNTGWFRSGPVHKATQLRRLMTELPHVRWVLVGDDGQHDPEIYAAAARARPEHVAAILVRQLTFAEHVLARGLPAAPPEAARAEKHAERGGIRVIQGADGRELLRAARTLELDLGSPPA